MGLDLEDQLRQKEDSVMLLEEVGVRVIGVQGILIGRCEVLCDAVGHIHFFRLLWK